MTAVYINDELIDLEEETTVAASYGNVSFGQWNKRKGVKSNTWTAPFSPRNKQVYEGSEVAGSHSLLPYRKNSIRVEIDGVVVFEGFCSLEKAKDAYEIQSFAGASDFFSIISNKKLNELDLSEFEHSWNETNIENSWANVEGYIYAFVEYGKEISGPIMPEYLLPQLFFHSVISAIVADAGYTITGDVLTNPRFKKHLVIANQWPLAISYGSTWNLATLLPDLPQSKLWLDFANIYGLQFDIDDITKEIRADYIDDILFSDPQDWTEKVDLTERPETGYHFEEYGQTASLRYKSESVTEANSCYQDFAKDVAIDDETLKLSADIYKSEFFLIQDVDPILSPDGRAITRTFVTKPGKAFMGIWDDGTAYVVSEGTVWYFGTYYKPIQAGTNQPPDVSPTYWEAVPEKDIWDVKSRPMYGILTTDVSSVIEVAFTTPATIMRIVNNTGMEWSNSYDLHYRVFDRIIQKTKRVEMLMKLNYSDINQLDFTRAKQVGNELYVLEEVTQFKMNKKESTYVNLVRL